MTNIVRPSLPREQYISDPGKHQVPYVERCLRRLMVVLRHPYMRVSIDLCNLSLAVVGIGGPFVAVYQAFLGHHWGWAELIMVMTPIAWAGVYYQTIETYIRLSRLLEASAPVVVSRMAALREHFEGLVT
jgi:hypothetical protein